MKTGGGKYRLERVVSFAKTIPGVTVHPGRRHRFLLKYSKEAVGNCALAQSTQEHHLLSYFKKVTDYTPHQIRQGMTKGKIAR